MLTAKNITYSVAGRELLSDVSATLEPGKLHLIIGPNGAGKSTLIKVLARHLRPQTGSVEYDHQDIACATDLDLAKRRAVLSQAVEVAFPLLVREVVMMGRYPHFRGRPGPVDERIVDEMMSLFEVSEFETRNYQTLSGGERQRVNFARVLAQLWPVHAEAQPAATRFLFLDEPLTFLDIKHQIDFMKRLREFTAAPDVVTVGVVHDLNLAAKFADQIVVIDAGKIVAAGTPTAVLTPSLIKNVFGIEPTVVSSGSGMQLVFE
jgi:iron complex transport system ATP-binding protein